jgi:hypothetical protein
MEYLLGSIVTATILLFAKRLFDRAGGTASRRQPIIYTQSYIYSLIKPLMMIYGEENKRLVTQSTKAYDKGRIKILFAENNAYWIANNTFYVADVVDGSVDEESIKPVDTMGMSKVQLDKMIFIVETLTEGVSDEDWNSRN